PADEKRSVLARMLRAERCRIVAVIGGHHAHLVGPQAAEDLAQALVELLERSSKPGRIVAVTVLLVEIHEVREHQAFAAAARETHERLFTLGVAPGMDRIGDPAPREELVHLAHRDDHVPALREPVENRGGWRLEREVAPSLGAAVP